MPDGQKHYYGVVIRKLLYKRTAQCAISFEPLSTAAQLQELEDAIRQSLAVAHPAFPLAVAC